MPVEGLKYAVPYLLFITYFILLTVTELIIEKRGDNLVVNRQIIRWLSVLALLVFFGFRGFIGWDWYLYYPSFNDIPSLLSFEKGLFTATKFEHGFVVYLAAIKSIFNNFHFFIFINTLIDIIILNEIIKRYSRFSYSFSCLVFIVMGGFFLETDLLRSAKSIMLFLLSIRYIGERKLVPYYLLNIAACYFHISAVLFLPLYFVLGKKIPRKLVIAIFSLGIIIFLLQIEYIRPFLYSITAILGERFQALLEKYLQISIYSTAYGFTIGLLERIVTATLLVIYYDKLIQEKSSNLFFINSYIIYFIVFFYFSEIKIIPVRVGGLFAFAYWVIYPAFVKVIQNKNNKNVLIFSFFLYSIIKIAGMTDTILYRYVNVLTGTDDFISRVKIFESSLDTLLR